MLKRYADLSDLCRIQIDADYRSGETINDADYRSGETINDSDYGSVESIINSVFQVDV